MSKPLILITRPAEDAEKFAELLAEKRLDAVSEPMLTIRATQEALDMLRQAAGTKPQAVIVTSRHALPLARHVVPLLQVPLYAAGAETAERARRAGFSKITHAPTISALMPVVFRQCSVGEGNILYLRGRDISDDIARKLGTQGFTATQLVVYEAEAATSLSPTLTQQLQAGGLALATFMSERTARVFMELVTQQGLAPALAQVRAIALSAKVAEALGSGWRSVTVASEPTLASLVDAVDKQLQGK